MVKTPRTRHSKPSRDPITIDLEPGAVSRVEEPARAAREKTEILDFGPDVLAGGNTQPESGEARQASVDAVSEAPHGAEPEIAAEKPEAGASEGALEDDRASATSETADRPQDPRAGDPPQPAGRENVAPLVAPRRSALSLVAAGLIGGAVALAGAGVLRYAGVLGQPNGGEAGNSAAVTADIEALKAELAALKSAGGGDVAGQVTGLAQSLQQVEAEVAALKQAVAAGGVEGGADAQALDGRLKQLEQAVAALGQAQGGTTPADIAAVNERIAGLDALVKAAGEAGSAAEGRIGALEQSLSALTAKVEAQAAQPKIALSIAAAALKSAIERGVPFLAEIETFAAVAPNAPEIAALRPYAEAGVATRAEIAAEADAAANAMIAAAKPADEHAGFFDRLLSSAESLVTVRPIGAVEGAGVPETVARMEVAIRAGDLKKAIAEFDTLSEAAKAAGAAFADKIRARIAVETLVDQAIASAMKA